MAGIDQGANNLGMLSDGVRLDISERLAREGEIAGWQRLIANRRSSADSYSQADLVSKLQALPEYTSRASALDYLERTYKVSESEALSAYRAWRKARGQVNREVAGLASQIQSQGYMTELDWEYIEQKLEGVPKNSSSPALVSLLKVLTNPSIEYGGSVKSDLQGVLEHAGFRLLPSVDRPELGPTLAASGLTQADRLTGRLSARTGAAAEAPPVGWLSEVYTAVPQHAAVRARLMLDPFPVVGASDESAHMQGVLSIYGQGHTFPIRAFNSDQLDALVSLSEPDLRDYLATLEQSGVRVVNMSHTFTRDTLSFVEKITRLSDILIVAAAGNDGHAMQPGETFRNSNGDFNRVAHLAGHSKVLIVSGYDDRDGSLNLNTGSDVVNLVEPGMGIRVHLGDDSLIRVIGSSISIAFTSNTGLKVRSLNPHLSAEQTRGLILDTASINPDFIGQIQGGRVGNAERSQLAAAVLRLTGHGMGLERAARVGTVTGPDEPAPFAANSPDRIHRSVQVIQEALDSGVSLEEAVAMQSDLTEQERANIVRYSQPMSRSSSLNAVGLPSAGQVAALEQFIAMRAATDLNWRAGLDAGDSAWLEKRIQDSLQSRRSEVGILTRLKAEASMTLELLPVLDKWEPLLASSTVDQAALEAPLAPYLTEQSAASRLAIFSHSHDPYLRAQAQAHENYEPWLEVQGGTVAALTQNSPATVAMGDLSTRPPALRELNDPSTLQRFLESTQSTDLPEQVSVDAEMVTSQEALSGVEWVLVDLNNRLDANNIDQVAPRLLALNEQSPSYLASQAIEEQSDTAKLLWKWLQTADLDESQIGALIDTGAHWAQIGVALNKTLSRGLRERLFALGLSAGTLDGEHLMRWIMEASAGGFYDRDPVSREEAMSYIERSTQYLQDVNTEGEGDIKRNIDLLNSKLAGLPQKPTDAWAVDAVSSSISPVEINEVTKIPVTTFSGDSVLAEVPTEVITQDSNWPREFVRYVEAGFPPNQFALFVDMKTRMPMVLRPYEDVMASQAERLQEIQMIEDTQTLRARANSEQPIVETAVELPTQVVKVSVPRAPEVVESEPVKAEPLEWESDTSRGWLNTTLQISTTDWTAFHTSLSHSEPGLWEAISTGIKVEEVGESRVHVQVADTAVGGLAWGVINRASSKSLSAPSGTTEGFVSAFKSTQAALQSGQPLRHALPASQASVLKLPVGLLNKPLPALKLPQMMQIKPLSPPRLLP